MTLMQAIINREDCTFEQAEKLIFEMAAKVDDGEDPENVLHDYGYEPDYIQDLLEYC